MTVPTSAAGWNSDGDDVELVESEPVSQPPRAWNAAPPEGTAAVPNAVSYGAPQILQELAALIPISTIYLGKPTSCSSFTDLKSYYEVLTEGDNLIYSVKDETPWYKGHHALLTLSDPAQNPALKLEFIEEHNYNVDIGGMDAFGRNNQQYQKAMKPMPILNPGMLQGDQMNGMNGGMGNQLGAIAGQQKGNMWMGYSSPKALKVTAAVAGTEIGTIIRKSITFFVVKSPTGEEVFHLELPDIFATQWQNIRAMVVTVKRPSVPAASAPESMQQLRMAQGCCGAGEKSPNYCIKTVPATTVEEKALLIAAAFMIDMPRRDAAADLRNKATNERMNSVNGLNSNNQQGRIVSAISLQ